MSYSAPNGTIEYEVKDGTAWIFLNNPATRNALDGAMQHDLEGVWREVNYDDSVRAVVVTSRGDLFSDDTSVEPDPRSSQGRLDFLATFAHQSVDDLSGTGLGPVDDAQGMFNVGLPDRPRGRPAKPLILAIRGACSGLALTFAFSADIVICSEDAEFFDRRVNAGDAPLEETAGLVYFNSLPRLIALRLAYQGDAFRIGADRAYQLGLATEVTPNGKLHERAAELAGYIGEASPAAVRALIAGYWDSVNLPYGQARLIAPLFGQQARTMDAKEGHAAAVEGREPVWPSLTSWSPPWPPFRLPTSG